MTERLELAPVLDLNAAGDLHHDFMARRGRALIIDAGSVQRLGAQCLQILLAAKAAWAADDQKLRLQAVSEEFTAALELLGTTLEELENNVTSAHEEFSACP
jgi:chemotaxis protein CheX